MLLSKTTLVFVVVLVVAFCNNACLGILLDCPPLPPHKPTNVSDLAPGDIKVVMTLGDSITAAFGVHGAAGGLQEIRGQSWSIGADANATTLPNFLKHYNPNIIGGSIKEHIVELCYGPFCPPFQYRPTLDVLNAAQSGAMVENLATHEVNYLVQQVKSNSKINIKEDWKLLTILIGANDLCASCTFAKSFLTADQFENHLMNTIVNVRKNLPRTLVQIAEMFNVSQVYNLSLKSNICANIHRLAFVECDCVFKPNGDKTRALIDGYTQQYNQRSVKVAKYFQSLNDPEFTVITQPFGRDTKLAEFPITALSTLDCFHPSLSTHQAMAINLWNNMLVPSEKKLTSLDLNAKPVCPTADTRIFTN